MTQKKEISESGQLPNKNFHNGLIWGRALLCLMIVAWHVQVLGTTMAFEPGEFSGFVPGPVDLVYFNLFHLAVPVFFLISLYLFSSRLRNDPDYLVKRMIRLGKLYFFWLCVAILILKVSPGIDYNLPGSWSELLLFFPSGGKTLFYFLFSLMLCTWLCHVCRSLSLKEILYLLIMTSILAGILPLLCRRDLVPCPLSAYWSPLNFIPYIFGALAVTKVQSKAGLWPTVWKRAFQVCLAVFLVMAALEWIFFKAGPGMDYDGLILPAYSRISVVAGSMGIFLFFLSVNTRPWRIIRMISSNSLGIYCVHGFVMIALMPFFSPGEGGAVNVVFFALVAAGSVVLSQGLRKVLPDGLI